MAVGLRARFDAAADLDFQKLVAQAMAEQAVVVYNEARATPPTAPQAARLAYALAVAADPPLSLVFNGGPIQGHQRTMAVARILTTQAIDKNSTDAAIIAGVANVWNALAGA
jgi:hypothetical protein